MEEQADSGQSDQVYVGIVVETRKIDIQQPKNNRLSNFAIPVSRGMTEFELAMSIFSGRHHD